MHHTWDPACSLQWQKHGRRFWCAWPQKTYHGNATSPLNLSWSLWESKPFSSISLFFHLSSYTELTVLWGITEADIRSLCVTWWDLLVSRPCSISSSPLQLSALSMWITYFQENSEVFLTCQFLTNASKMDSICYWNKSKLAVDSRGSLLANLAKLWLELSGQRETSGVGICISSIVSLTLASTDLLGIS